MNFSNKVVNRLGVAGVVLQTHPSLIAELQISPDLPVQQKKSGEALYLGGCRGRRGRRGRCLYAELGTRTNMSATEVE